MKNTNLFDWVMFTKRTNDPKLSWLEMRLDENNIKHRRNGESFHAPILEVQRKDEDKAWKILDPVDDIPDDDEMFIEIGNPLDDEQSLSYFNRYIAGDR